MPPRVIVPCSSLRGFGSQLLLEEQNAGGMRVRMKRKGSLVLLIFRRGASVFLHLPASRHLCLLDVNSFHST